jgi:hypothetical protein
MWTLPRGGGDIKRDGWPAHGEEQFALDCAAMKASNNVYFNQRGDLNALEVYKRESEEILKRFRAKRLTLSECVACLISALDSVDPAARTAQRESLRTWVASNNEEVTKELARQGLAQYIH